MGLRRSVKYNWEEETERGQIEILLMLGSLSKEINHMQKLLHSMVLKLNKDIEEADSFPKHKWKKKEERLEQRVHEIQIFILSHEERFKC